MKQLSCFVIVLEKGAATKTKEDHVMAQFLVADSTGSIVLSAWDTDGEGLQPGDILRLTNGYASSILLYLTAADMHRSSRTRWCSTRGGELPWSALESLLRVISWTTNSCRVCLLYAETPNMSAVQFVQEPGGGRNFVMMLSNFTAPLMHDPGSCSPRSHGRCTQLRQSIRAYVWRRVCKPASPCEGSLTLL
jgi:hypothetical protein